MKVSKLWLKSFIELPLSLEQLNQQLTQAGVEVNAVEAVAHKTITGWNICPKNSPPARGDCLSIEDLSRELSALSRTPIISGIMYRKDKKILKQSECLYS